MKESFREFIEKFKETWRNSSISELREMICNNYEAQEIRNQEKVNFGYKESIDGWEQAFNYVKNHDAEWMLTEVGVIPLRNDEVMVILWATLVVDGKKLETANLFFETFRYENGDWKLVRSYIEAGLPLEKMVDLGTSDLILKEKR
ncbi:flavoprotein [Fictibacillus nanhaiensis]|uniref:flavoprotein n=1 Tax=Fictibacillus nanhaiensis TaxID=742169 RepID=UPI001C985ECF|nr:flavoprotein [Fictibacillus nanhaiensis]MBY6036608.1 flavoprotein [Fictibacillus nanhaiensis]